MTNFAKALLLGTAMMAGAAQAATYQNPAERTVVIRSEPIAGVFNAPWFNYLADVNEADKELVNDLEGSSDDEDRRDAWEEYHHELTDADKDYVKEMRERGYRAGRVTVG